MIEPKILKELQTIESKARHCDKSDFEFAFNCLLGDLAELITELEGK